MTGVVPDGYDAYVRVLHPVETNDDRFLRWRDVAAITKREVHPLVQWWRLIDAQRRTNPNSALWDNGQPVIGALDEPDSQTLIDTLACHTTTEDNAYFGLWEGSGHFHSSGGIRIGIDEAGNSFSEPIPVTPAAARLAAGPRLRHPGRAYLLMNGPLTAAHTIAELIGATPFPLSGNLVWPADRTWFIGTEVDFDSTLVGCSRSAADDLLDHPDLEALLIGPEDSLRYDADLPNG